MPNLITVAQFRELPEGGEYVYELHHGEVVALARPKARRAKLQHRLSRLLAPKLHTFGEVTLEAPYRPLAEFDLRAADVAVISHRRYDEIDPDDNLRGAPELFIEVKSPSNSRKQLPELAALCLGNGARDFLFVDPAARTVAVIRSEGSAVLYSSGDSIPLNAFAGAGLAVHEIFV